jgi:hypothetical protein
MTSIGNALRGVGALIKRWPVRAQALIVAGIAMGSAFGLGWDGAQVGAVSAFTAAALALLTEQAVTPLSEPSLPAGTSVNVTTAGPTPDRAVTI